MRHARTTLLRLTCTALLTLTASLAFAQVQITGTARVLDGDTLDLSGVRIRLFGVDAPESAQTCTRPDGASWACGTEARQALERKLANQPLRCDKRDIDNYGRIVAVCSLGNEDINSWLAANGWVVAYRQFSLDYTDEEAAAKGARMNLWNGSFQPPEEFRRAQGNNRSATTSTEANCKIKGNISTSGDRIYHVPGGEFYEQTMISAAQGERMFCSEQEAKSAGWRRSRR